MAIEAGTMAELKLNRAPYRLEEALAADGTDKSGCFILDVGSDENGAPVASLEKVVKIVDDYLIDVLDRLAPITKLYVVGEWHLAEQPIEHVETEEPEEQTRYANEPHISTKPEQEWHKAGQEIAKFVQQMTALKELTWISSLPFMACIWEKLSTSLTKLVLDLGQPVRLQQDGDMEYKSYITVNEMKPLLQQTQLKELRLFRMHDSFQSVYWEAVFRNVSESGMCVIDLQMAAAPIVRKEHWHKAENVVGLTVPKEHSKEKEYKGVDGKGVLHYSFGTGEYLDDFCMRKARIASGLEEANPLPLWCLKLDGFVVDYLPFEHELSRIVLLTCGENCIDSGLRAPKTPRTPHNRWSKVVNNAPSHCLIQWPNWTGVFDDHGDQRDTHGDVVPQEAGYSNPADDIAQSPSMPLTKETLDMKEKNDVYDGVSKGKGHFKDTPTVASSSDSEPLMTIASKRSTRGPEGPLPMAALNSPPIPAVDGSTTFGTASPAGATLAQTDSGTTLVSVSSTDSSFEQVSPPADCDTVSDAATAGSNSHAATAGSITSGDSFSKTSTLKHKDTWEGTDNTSSVRYYESA
ncbi:hypothetical protein BDW02DRAFT_647814 [Decorospora gaudefroyi]|uniref:Uncharacterized protein n=1 Tax=Decorospora gaudefroyi TaxID=184978 RepID=A0A6A5KFS8_9PLEO|nr:hypothetical protein BDW02DRAFT_647814 [Decorospora gaudefroyi]